MVPPIKSASPVMRFVMLPTVGLNEITYWGTPYAGLPAEGNSKINGLSREELSTARAVCTPAGALRTN